MSLNLTVVLSNPTLPTSLELDGDAFTIQVEAEEQLREIVHDQVNQEVDQIVKLQHDMFKRLHALNGACLASSSGRKYFDVDSRRCEECAGCGADEELMCRSLCGMIEMNEPYSLVEENKAYYNILTVVLLITCGLVLFTSLMVMARSRVSKPNGTIVLPKYHQKSVDVNHAYLISTPKYSVV